MRRRLLYIVGGLVQGGLEQQLLYLLSSLDRERYEPAVLVWRYSENDPYVDRFRSLHVPLYGFAPAMPRASKLSQARRLVRELRPDVVHSCNFYTNFGAEWSGRATGAIRVGSIRRDFASEVAEAGPCLGALCTRWPRMQICNSFNAAARARRGGAAELRVVRNGLDLTRFPATAVPGGDGTAVAIAAVGALEPLKRWDRLIDAIAVLRRAGVNVRARLAGDGSCRPGLVRQAHELGVEDVVKIEGYVDDVAGLLRDSAFLVHTSDAEGCPNAVMEAMAASRAVVATDAGDTPALIQHARTGFVVPRGDRAALIDAMARLIRDRALCEAMGAAGRTRAEADFSLDRLVSDTFRAYRDAGWKEAAC